MQENRKKQLLLIGRYPPPYGGIAVHIQRLYRFCIKKKIVCKILDTGSHINRDKANSDVVGIFNIIKLLKIKSDDPIVHIHVSAFGNILKIFLLIKLFSSQKKILTIHSGSFVKNISKVSRIKKYLLLSLLKKMDRIISVNKEQEMILISQFNINSKKIDIIPAFIFPSASNAEFSEGEKNQITDSNKFKLITSGYLYNFYGYDLILDYLDENKNLTGVFIFYGGYDYIYRKQIIQRIKQMENVIYYENLSPESFNWLLKNSTAYVRNTDRDGDCVAIREAAYWGIKVIASDSVNRPDGVKLFQHNSKKWFYKAMKDIIDIPNCGRILSSADNAEKIYKIYQKLCI